MKQTRDFKSLETTAREIFLAEHEAVREKLTSENRGSALRSIIADSWGLAYEFHAHGMQNYVEPGDEGEADRGDPATSKPRIKTRKD